MEFQKRIEKRRTVRKYAKGNAVTKEDILAMVKASPGGTVMEEFSDWPLLLCYGWS